jgi:hypothetical protein
MQDVRQDWFMQQHFSEVDLQQIYEWEQISGKVAEVVPIDNGFNLHHIEDKERKIDLCFMQEEYMLRRWAERLGYTMSDGKTSKQFDEENGKQDPPYVPGEEVFRKGRTTLTLFGERKMHIVSGDYALVAKRTASNAYEILLLDGKEYTEYLEEQKVKI